MEVEISRIHPEARLPEYKTKGAACFDFETVEETLIAPNEIKFVPTGLVIRCPEGYFLEIAPRSSNGRLGLMMPHSVGILDSDYCGPADEVKILLKNITDKPIIIEKFQRIAQGFFVKAPKVIWKEIDTKELGTNSRGGFGSTGHK